MQPLSTTPGFWFVNANIAAVESLSVIVTVPAEKVFPAFSVVPDSAAHVPGPATDHNTVSMTTLRASRANVAGRGKRLRGRPPDAGGTTWTSSPDRRPTRCVDSAVAATGFT